MSKVAEKKKTKKATKKGIPKALIYEMRHGSPIYYRDYEKVLAGEKTLEEVMGSSELQAILTFLLLKWLATKLDTKKYLVATNEVGYKFAPKSWYNLDIAIVERDKIKKPSDKYLTATPKVVIEIDTKADLNKFDNPQDYFHRKTQDLLDSGVEKVIWIFTKDKKLWFAENGKRWFITNWDDDLELLDNIQFNLQKLIDEEGLEI
jgi:Uma2 family endonuclease